MLKISKVSAIVLIFYILFYLQIWGDNYLILYGSAIITVLSTLIHCIFMGNMNLSKVPYGVWNNLIIVLYSLITGIFIVSNYFSLVNSCITFTAYSMVIISICYVSAEENSFSWVLQVLIAIAVLCALFAIFKGNNWEGYGKTLSRFNNPHAFAAVMNLGIFSTAYLEKKERNINTLYSCFLIALFLFSIIECGSRKYLIASTFFVIMWVLAMLRNIWNEGYGENVVYSAVVVMLIVVLGVFFYRKVYIYSNSYSRMLNMEDLSNGNRIRFYISAFNVFLEHPLFGGGYDQFGYLSGVGGYAHSTYAEAIADFGLLGSIIYFTPIVVTIYKTAKRALFTNRNYKNWILFTFCASELFIGTTQVFFMEFYHFLAWAALFYYVKEPDVIDCKYGSAEKKVSKYLRI